MVARVESFPPFAARNSKVLILGSMPGVVSLQTGEYYAHPRNAFWPIMGELFDAGPSLSFAKRKARLKSLGIAVWDSLQACVRPGSADASISDEVGNDFVAFFADHPNITNVFFNGAKAEQAFRRHALPTLMDSRHVFTRLPSTSPAHAGLPFKAKVKAWSAVKKALG